ncbi:MULTISPECIES: arsenate reductase [Paenibacillus]|nr:arsenate reductase [Paenibacillus lautus]VTR56562.1 Arsenate reductase [Actinobacillus pleuropneumoniae]
MKYPVRVFFLSYHNNYCRSQMAEAFMSFCGRERVRVGSGGILPQQIHPLTFQVMDEVGIPLYRPSSVQIDMVTLIHSDLIVVLCNDRIERCPRFPASYSSIHWNFVDPLVMDTSTILDFRRIRDLIRMHVLELCKQFDLPCSQTSF